MKATVAEAVEVVQLPSLTVRSPGSGWCATPTDFNPIHYRNTSHAGRAARCHRSGHAHHGNSASVVTNWVGDPAGSPPTSSGSPGHRWCMTRGVEVEFSGSVSAIEGSLVTVSIEAICAGQKVLGAARAEVDLVCGSRIVIMKAEPSLTEQATGVVLADHTTLRVGGPARRMITVETEAELVEAVRTSMPPANHCWCWVEARTCWSATPASMARCSRSLREALLRTPRHVPAR